MISPQNVMLSQAQAYAKSGMHVFPVKEKCKQPANSNSFKGATTSPETIQSFWQTTAFNVGLATGEINTLIVVDVDDE